MTKEALTAALRNPQPEVRQLAAQKLAADGDKDAIPAIMEALSKETAPINRLNIALSLAQLGEETGIATLKTICDSSMETGSIRMLAAIQMVDFLHNYSCRQDVFDILRNSHDPDAQVQPLSALTRYIDADAPDRPSEERLAASKEEKPQVVAKKKTEKRVSS